MKKSFIIKPLAVCMFFILWVSCGESNEEPEKPEDGIKIENMHTWLRIVDGEYLKDHEGWDANPRNMIINYPFNKSSYFGYTDEKGEVLLCKVTNFPDSAKNWKGEFVHKIPLCTITEVNILVNGIVRIDTNDKGQKYGTMELISLAPSGAESNKPMLQLGRYIQTYPIDDHIEKVIIDFIDREKVIFSVPGEPGTPTYKYEIRTDDHTIILNDINDNVKPSATLFFRVVSNTEFELINLFAETGDKVGYTIMSFEREK